MADPLSPTAPQHLASVIDALGQDGFETVLDQWLGAELSYDNITVLAYPPSGAPELLYRKARRTEVHARLDSAYLKGAYLLDPFHQLHVDHAPDGLYHLAEIAPDHFTRGDYFLTYYAATTLTDEMTYLSRSQSGATITVCLGRDASSGKRFSARDLAQAGRIKPIALALMTRHWRGFAAETTALRPPTTAETLRLNTQSQLGIDLTPRQSETAVLILKGHSTGSIALNLDLSPGTVKVFRKQLYQRCGISSQAELFSLLLPMLGSPEGH
jgi:Response regulator containing a CheY-like receiver domain and an HTH DNA-binding domain